MCIFSKRLSSNLQAWERIGAPATVRSWIVDGIDIPFLDSAPPDGYYSRPHSFSPKESAFVEGELTRLELTGALERVYDRPLCVSPIKCVTKKGGKLRLITDLSRLNHSVDAPHFQNEGINVASQLVGSGDYFVKTDLKDGFLHIPVHKSCRQYLGFEFKGTFYVWCVLPFGLSCSPYFFYKCLRPVVTFLRSQGIRIILYVDDCLIIAQRASITDHGDFVLQTFEDLGFVINYDKSILTPVTCIEFIGYVIDSLGPDGKPWVSITQARIRKLKKDISRAIAKGYIQARLLAKIAGQAITMCRAILPGKLKLRSIYALLRSRELWSDLLLIDTSAKTDLQWWLSAIDTWNGSPLSSPPVELQIWTDASDTGWGAACGQLEASGSWDLDHINRHINYKELLAVLLALQSFAFQIQGKSVQIMTDNSTTMAYLNNMGGPSALLTDLAEKVWAEALSLNVTLLASHVAGISNTHADALSRMPTQYEWMLHPTVFRYIDGLWGPHTIDRFASIATTQLPRYNSRFYDPMTQGVDALSQQDWAEHNNFVNPPFRLLPKVLAKVIQQKAYATVVAPLWPSQPWFRTLQGLLVAAPFRIRCSPQSMLQVGSIAEPLKNRRWKVYAWRIYSGRDLNR